jgi:hypothetical protein
VAHGLTAQRSGAERSPGIDGQPDTAALSEGPRDVCGPAGVVDPATGVHQGLVARAGQADVAAPVLPGVKYSAQDGGVLLLRWQGGTNEAAESHYGDHDDRTLLASLTGLYLVEVRH